MKLLIADDERAIREGIASLPWEEIGINQVYEVENGILAKEILQKFPIDIVISDIKMPGITGLEIAQYVKEYNLDTAMVLLTGFSDFEFAQHAIRSEVMDYMLKPVRAQEIMDTVLAASERLKQRRYKAKVVRQYERDADIVDLSEQLQYHFRGMNKPTMKILQDMATGFTHEISLNSIARKYHFSVGYLSRMIKKETGYSFSDILVSMRLFEAMLLLKENEVKVGFIGERVGFKDSRYFSQIFKKIFACTLSEYRKNIELQRGYSIKRILEIMQEKK